jgi:hypothetical protein
VGADRQGRDPARGRRRHGSRQGLRAPALAVAALLAVACGEDDSPQAVARAWVATNEPSKCGLLRPELLEQLTGQTGAAARRTCERNVARAPARRDVRVAEVEISGARAEVEVRFRDGETRVQLLRGADGWRISGLVE